MGFSKYTRSEKTEVLSPDEHKVVQEELQKMGKTSAKSLTEEERNNISEALESDD